MSDAGEDVPSRPKIEDVAREAGVSIMSVSRAMRGVDGISPQTRQRILKAAERMGYVPSRLAGSLAAATSNLIAISVPTLFEVVFAEIIDGMRSTLLNAGYETMIGTSDFSTEREAAWIARMIQWSPAGLVVCGQHRTDEARQQLMQSHIPVLEIWDRNDGPIDLCVGFDHTAAGSEMGRYLVGLGYRRPAFIGTPPRRDPRAEKRLDGFAAAFSESGVSLAADVRVDGPPSFEAGYDGTISALSAARRPDVLYFLNDHLAFGGLMACANLGIPVPQAIGIAGFNGLNINNVLDTPLTTSVTPRRLMGSTGARMLIAAINGVRTERSVVMPVELIPGETTRPRPVSA